MVGKTFVVLLLISMKNNFLKYISALKMAFIKLVGKTFTVRWKSKKTAKVFFCIGFVVYGMLLHGIMRCKLYGHVYVTSHDLLYIVIHNNHAYTLHYVWYMCITCIMCIYTSSFYYKLNLLVKCSRLIYVHVQLQGKGKFCRQAKDMSTIYS